MAINSHVASRCVACGSPRDYRLVRCGCCDAPVALADWDEAKHPRAEHGRWGAGHNANYTQTGAAAPVTAHGYAVDRSAGTQQTVAAAVAMLPPEIGGAIGEVAVLTAPDEAKRRKQQPCVQAKVFPGDTTIYVNHWCSAFEDAAKGKPTELAAALAHEAWHQAHGPDEAGAYDQQLAVLKQLGAKKDLIERIKYSKEMAVYQQQFEQRRQNKQNK